ncbi:hypothetical protein CYMTET_16393 [Cymbomonas tetramitiformis]|uniref:Uncharacterized protein n=1 Tax=Cymbomonas tetramitiformis TaxID=36881 RepID=A0AAE0GCC3_9CHLO|nr:hypothetical protein CYMTET_16393 [Cymbomonas tetramitiformis]
MLVGRYFKWVKPNVLGELIKKPIEEGFLQAQPTVSLQILRANAESLLNSLDTTKQHRLSELEKIRTAWAEAGMALSTGDVNSPADSHDLSWSRLHSLEDLVAKRWSGIQAECDAQMKEIELVLNHIQAVPQEARDARRLTKQGKLENLISLENKLAEAKARLQPEVDRVHRDLSTMLEQLVGGKGSASLCRLRPHAWVFEDFVQAEMQLTLLQKASKEGDGTAKLEAALKLTNAEHRIKSLEQQVASRDEDLERLKLEKEALLEEQAALQKEKAEIESEKDGLLSEKDGLLSEKNEMLTQPTKK